jgi:type I restriction-modification system DNA methylase subunit
LVLTIAQVLVIRRLDLDKQNGVPDTARLIDHFNKGRLRNEDFEFPDLLGAAYEYFIDEFADSAGKKGGEVYTPWPDGSYDVPADQA